MRILLALLVVTAAVAAGCGTDAADDAEPSAGTPLSTTPEHALAPKAVTFKCEDVDDTGESIGPVFVTIRGASDGPVEDLGWMTQSEARRVAKRYSTRLSLDC